MKDKIIEILGKEIWISEDYDARKDKSQYFIEGIDNATDELLTLFNSEIAKRDELIRAMDEWIRASCKDMTFINGGEYIVPPSYKIYATHEMWQKINKLKAEIK